MANGIYAYPKLNRAGLGNLLFPWARCEIFRTRHQIPMLAPQWTQPKIGPMLRRERDMRYYTGLFSQKDYIGGLRKWWLLSHAQRIPETQAEAFMARSASEKVKKSLLVFEEMEGMFDPLAGHRDLIHNRLRAILRPAILKRITPLASGPVIGLHVRHGDKVVLESAERKRANFRYRIHDDWYLTTIAQVRKLVGKDIPVVVFTDAKPGEITGLQDVPNVTMAENNPSIVDILRLSLASVMIGTSTSTFGMWSAFLTGIPSIWYPAEHTFTLTPDKPGFQIMGHMDGTLPEGCEKLLREALS
jgi:hypothetical protein